MRARVEDVYAKQDPAPVDPSDLRGRMRGWGLYPQRRQGIPSGRTATIAPEELADGFFMMRVRIEGSQLTTEQIHVLAGISQEFARDTADITDRANLQYHWVQIEDVPEIWRRLESVDLHTTEARGDCTRVVVGSPVAGIAAAEVLDATVAIQEIRGRYIGGPSQLDLPRKFKTSIAWLPDCTPEINDVSFVGVEHPELGPGFDLLVGGGLSVAPRLAVRLGTFVALERVPEVWFAVTSLFRDYGSRVLRGRARMKFLVDDWGATKLRDVLETEYLKSPLPDGPAAPVPDRHVDHVGIHDQHDGRKYVGFSTIAGRVSGETLAEVADAVDAAGSNRLRFTSQQKLLVFDVDAGRTAALITRLAEVGLYAEPSPWRRSVMACTGLEFCKLAIVDTKQRAADLVEGLERRLGELNLDLPISVHLNGCPNSCARVQTADIGLKGQIVTTSDGERVEGFQVQLGGGLGADAGFARKVRAFKVVSAELGDYIERVVLRYLEHRADGERFAQWAQRADEKMLK